MIQLPGLFAGVPWLVHSTPTQFFISILSIPIAKVQHGSESTHEPQTCWKKKSETYNDFKEQYNSSL